MLASNGVDREKARRINQFAHGHPLALKLAVAAVAERSDLYLEEVVSRRVIEELVRVSLEDVRDPVTRKVLNAASVVRRATRSLLQAMVPEVASQDAYDRLHALPFVGKRARRAGPALIEGWLSNHVDAALGIESDDVLDVDAKELVLGDRRTRLTRLEFEVMNYLYRNNGKMSTRSALLDEVWGIDYEGGSDVVDVVIRSLRKKLGSQALLIETVTEMGYRFRKPGL